MLYKGIYHLFYQYNPNGVVWGPPVWGHSTSTDMINWSPQPLTIKPEIPANKYGSWSGSATILPGNYPVILFTGIINQQNGQVQDIALPKDPNDPFLKEWYVPKANNPVIYPTPQNGINASSFRDPTTAWILPDGKWRVLVGNKIGTEGVALLFKSKDFIHWGLAKRPLYSYQKSGMWECPDFFPVYANGNSIGVEDSIFGRGVKHVLKVSLDDTKHDVYTVGNYNVKKDGFTPDVGFMNASSLRYDYGKYYASKTFFDGSKKRRILLGWANESSSVEDDVKKGWSGIHTIPRQIWLDKSKKQLIQWPIAEIETLRRKPVNVNIRALKGGSTVEVKGVTAVQADASITFKIKDLSKIEKYNPSWTDPQLLCSRKGVSAKGGVGPFGLLTLASKGLEEYTAVFFRVFKDHEKFVVLMCSDQSRSSKNPTTDKTTYGTFVDVDPIAEGLSLRTLIDHSVVESYGAKGKNVITARAYPTLATFKNVHLYAFNYGSSNVEVSELKAWSMKKARIA
ncbi:beta-fructofuranosidase, insoluble isoenzyme CWINV1-like [Silene latifolia]|uniref:beta-fructofuranosidase, insoluble isoenzyme CWINV1-like n=1 Tax=Silene latifolia TaxID=37657 RepID=UPI003D76E9DC